MESPSWKCLACAAQLCWHLGSKLGEGFLKVQFQLQISTKNEKVYLHTNFSKKIETKNHCFSISGHFFHKSPVVLVEVVF